MLILKLKPWDERPDDADNVQSVIGQVYALTADIKDASVFRHLTGYDSGLRYG